MKFLTCKIFANLKLKWKISNGPVVFVDITFTRKSGMLLLESISLVNEKILNNHDRYAVAVTKDRTIVGHLPRKVSRVCSLFLKRGGRIDCVVTGRWRYSLDLRQGGLEVRVNYYLLLKQIIIFKSLIIRTINFCEWNFQVGSTYEIILTAKLSRSTVFVIVIKYNCHVFDPMPALYNPILIVVLTLEKSLVSWGTYEDFFHPISVL